MKVNLKFENKIPEDFIADNTEEKTEIIPQESKISENYILVDLTERDPPQKSWCYPKLYKTGALGKNLSWQIGFDDDTKKLIIHHGYEDGSVVVKSVSLETKGGKTIYQQALQEAKHRLHQKSQVGYMTAYGMNLSDLPGVKQPMLAGKWVKGKTRLTFPIYIEPKINGIRMLSKNRKDGIECRTRKSKIYPFLSRIKIALRTLFSYLPEGSEIDGELYKHGMDLQDINSIVRKTVSPHPNEDCISYFMFDIILKDKIPFEERHEILRQACKECIADCQEIFIGQSPPLYFVDGSIIHKEEEIEIMSQKYESIGYEGAMLKKITRNPHDPNSVSNNLIDQSIYKPTRTMNILKVKSFDDEEGIVIGATCASGDHEGCVIWKVKDPRGNEFLCYMGGNISIEKRRWYYEHYSEFIGKQLTYKYYGGLSKDGIPQQPVGLGFYKDDE